MNVVITTDRKLVVSFNKRIVIKDSVKQLLEKNSNKKRNLQETRPDTSNSDFNINDLVEVTMLTGDGGSVQVELESWDETGMKFKLDNLDPSLLSAGLNPDSISVRFKDPSMIQDEYGKPLQAEDAKFEAQAPPQLPEGMTEDLLNSQVSLMRYIITVVIATSVFFQLVIRRSLDQVWSLFNALQLICYLKCFGMPMPAVTSLLNEQFVHIIEFQTFSIETLIKLSNPDFSLRAALLGSENLQNSAVYSMLDDLMPFFTLFIFMVAGLLLVALAFIVLPSKREKLKTVLKNFKDMMFWSGILRCLMIVYLPVSLAVCAQMYTWTGSEILSGADKFRNIVMLVFVLLFLTWTFFILFRYRVALQSKELRSSE